MAIKCATLDFETLGTEPSTVVLSAGLTAFNLDATNTWDQLDTNSIFILLDPRSQKARTTTPETIEWWNKQSPTAYAMARQGSNKLPLTKAVQAIIEFIKAKNVEYIISNGISFDAMILKNMCNQTGLPYPVKYWGDLDLRTMLLLSSIKRPPFPVDKVQHHAKDDAIHEALCAQKYYAACNNA